MESIGSLPQMLNEILTSPLSWAALAFMGIIALVYDAACTAPKEIRAAARVQRPGSVCRHCGCTTDTVQQDHYHDCPKATIEDSDAD